MYETESKESIWHKTQDHFLPLESERLLYRYQDVMVSQGGLPLRQAHLDLAVYSLYWASLSEDQLAILLVDLFLAS